MRTKKQVYIENLFPWQENMKRNDKQGQHL